MANPLSFVVMAMTMLRSVCVMAMLSLSACDAPRSTGGTFVPVADAATGSDAVTTPDVTAAQPDVVTTQDDVVTAQDDVVVAQPDVVTPPTDVVVSQPDVVMAARCGDGTCTRRMMENCQSCPSDCGACTFNGGLMDPCPNNQPQGPTRNCGWRNGMVLSCLRNRATMVGCTAGAGAGSLCQPSYGACTGDPVMRVCPGTAPCTAANALPALSGSFDDQCGACPSGYVTCPDGGMIFVMTGDYDSFEPTQNGTCSPVAR